MPIETDYKKCPNPGCPFVLTLKGPKGHRDFARHVENCKGKAQPKHKPAQPVKSKHWKRKD